METYLVKKSDYRLIGGGKYTGEGEILNWHFSTIEAAQKFIEENKLKYSLNDIVNSFPFTISAETGSKILDNLKKLNK